MDADKIKTTIHELLISLGENPQREGLVETPKRVAKAYQKILEGYSRNLADEIKVFENSAGYDDLIISSGIEFFSICEHHLLPFWGHATVAYIPDKTIIGLSKLSRAVDIYARRLQDQERITTQVADELMRLLKPKGVAVMLDASHFCNIIRGVEKKDSSMRTLIFRGVMKDNESLQMKFLMMAQTATK